jgi:hypothetical protein
MLEWLLAGAALLIFLALLPRLLGRTRPRHRKPGGGSGVMLGLGLVFAMIFDPKASAAIELIDRKQDEREDAESGDQP